MDADFYTERNATMVNFFLEMAHLRESPRQSCRKKEFGQLSKWSTRNACKIFHTCEPSSAALIL
jgi:hypothetical protein